MATALEKLQAATDKAKVGDIIEVVGLEYKIERGPQNKKVAALIHPSMENCLLGINKMILEMSPLKQDEITDSGLIAVHTTQEIGRSEAMAMTSYGVVKKLTKALKWETTNLAEDSIKEGDLVQIWSVGEADIRFKEGDFKLVDMSDVIGIFPK